MLMSLLPEIIAGLMLTSSGALAIAKREEIMDKIKRMKIPIEFEAEETEMTANQWISLYIAHQRKLKRTFTASVPHAHVLTYYKKQPITIKQYMELFEQWETIINQNYDFIESNNRHFFSVFIPETAEFFASFNTAYVSDPTPNMISQACASTRYVYIPSTSSDTSDYVLNTRIVRDMIHQYQKVFGMMYHFHNQQVEMVKDRNKNSLDQISVSMENTFSYVASNGDAYGYEIEEGLFEEVPMIETEKIEEIDDEDDFLTSSSYQNDEFIQKHSLILQSEINHYRGVYEYEGLSFKNSDFDGSSRNQKEFHYILVGDFNPTYSPGSQSHPQLASTRRMHVMTDSFSKPGDARPYKMVTINNYQPSQLQIHDSEFFFHYVKEKLPSAVSMYEGPAHLRHLHHAKYVVFFRDSLFYGNFEQIKEMLEIYFINPKEEYFRDLPARELRFLKREMGIPDNHIFYRSN